MYTALISTLAYSFLFWGGVYLNFATYLQLRENNVQTFWKPSFLSCIEWKAGCMSAMQAVTKRIEGTTVAVPKAEATR